MNSLKASRARLKILMSDACATKKKVGLPTGGIALGSGRGEGFIPVSPLFRRLFREAEGVVDIVSAKEGQGAFGNSDHTKGGIFTSNVVAFLASNSQNKSVTWDQLFTSVAKSTNDAFKAQFPSGEWLSDGTSQRTQLPDKLELRVNYKTPEPAIVEVNGPMVIDAADGRAYRTKQTIRNGLVTKTIRDGFVGEARKTPASDGSWFWVYHGTTVYAQDQSPPNGFFYISRLGTEFFQMPYGGIHVIRSREGSPGSRLITPNNNRWLLEYGETIVKLNGVDVSTVDALKSAVRSSPDKFVMVVNDGISSHRLSGSFSGQNSGGNGLGQNSRRKLLGVGLGTGTNGATVITSVDQNGPAMKCWDGSNREIYLETGDELYSINGRRVQSVNDAVAKIQQSNQRMRFQVRNVRDGSIVDLTVNLALVGAQNQGNMGGGQQSGSGNRVPLGLSLSTTTNGVRITSVTQNSPATRCTNVNTGQSGIALEVGDYILAVNGTSVGDYRSAVNLVDSTERYLSLRVRDHRTGNVLNLKTELRGN